MFLTTFDFMDTDCGSSLASGVPVSLSLVPVIVGKELESSSVLLPMLHCCRGENSKCSAWFKKNGGGLERWLRG